MARGIAEADSVDIAANAHAATPISNRRFIFAISWAPRYRGEDAMIREPIGSALRLAIADLGRAAPSWAATQVQRGSKPTSIARRGYSQLIPANGNTR